MDENRMQTEVTRLLGEVQNGDRAALDRLFALVYDELQVLARRQRQRWQGNYTLDTTALVHEAYVKLVDQSRINVESRAHFHALAARAMRHILCNYARERSAKKRGGSVEKLPLEEMRLPVESTAFMAEQSEVLAALDDALERLEQVDPRQSKVVECRFFGGMTIDETAAALEVSARTVKRDWAVAQAWLHRELEGRR